jgi:hypothetical protein
MRFQSLPLFGLRVAVAATALLLPLRAFAELPFLTREEREQRATVILTGTVKQVRHQLKAGREKGFVDDQVVATMEIDRLQKGDLGRPQQKIRVHYWRAKERPVGWAGPGGQARDLQVGDRVRVYLVPSGPGRQYELLIPNGWESPAAP